MRANVVRGAVFCVVVFLLRWEKSRVNTCSTEMFSYLCGKGVRVCLWAGGGEVGSGRTLKLIIKIKALNSKFLNLGSGNESALIRKL